MALHIGCTLPRKGIGTVFAVISAFTWPVISAVIVASTAEVKVGLQLSDRLVISITESLDVGFVLDVCQGLRN
jgi:hypothetical protein